MIAYRAGCPGCGRDCWWYAYPVHQPAGGQTSMVRVQCRRCDVEQRALRAEKLNELVAI